MNDKYGTTFTELESGATFHRRQEGRNVTYVKLDDYKAQVTHDPKAELVGCVFSFAGPWPVTPGPSPEFQQRTSGAKQSEREIHEERKAKLEADYEYWTDQYTKKPDMIAAAMREAAQNGAYATTRILDLLDREPALKHRGVVVTNEQIYAIRDAENI